MKNGAMATLFVSGDGLWVVSLFGSYLASERAIERSLLEKSTQSNQAQCEVDPAVARWVWRLEIGDRYLHSNGIAG